MVNHVITLQDETCPSEDVSAGRADLTSVLAPQLLKLPQLSCTEWLCNSLCALGTCRLETLSLAGSGHVHFDIAFRL